jgi:cellobiose phosphorylase
MTPTSTVSKPSSHIPDPKQTDGLRNPFGHFDEKKREFVITNPHTPAPWVNYISNGSYHGLVSHAGGGLSFFRSPRDNRILRWRYNSYPFDRPGRYVYVRDADSGDYWSLSWQPTELKIANYECRHGLNYSTIRGRCRSIASEITYFVPLSHNCELWWVKLRNRSKKPRRLQVFGYAELCLGHALNDLINQPNDKHFSDVFFLKDREVLMASRRYWVTYTRATVEQPNKEWPFWAFLGSSLPVRGFDGALPVFLGPWRSEANPAAIERGVCFNTEVTAGDPCACLQNEIVLEPGEEKELVYILGITPKNVSGDGAGGTAQADRVGKASGSGDPMATEPLPATDASDAEKLAILSRRQDALDVVSSDAAAEVVRHFRDLNNVRAAYDALGAELRDYLSAVQVDVPDPAVRVLLNCWNQYQVKTTFQFSRDASYYHGGLMFGRGYRDSCQDILGPLVTRPAWVKNRLLEQASRQFSTGRCYHLYYPWTSGGENTGHSDTALWLPFAICQYVKETLDNAFLDEVVPYCDEISEGKEPPRGTVLEHALRALDYTITRLSPRNLALFGPGDWNDTLDYLGRKGKGESVWVSLFFCYAVREMIGLLRHIGKHDTADHYTAWYEKVKTAINSLAWDGQWYIRGTNDLGEVIGSAACEEGKIFLNAQTWAVISGVADDERARRAMDSAWRHLRTPKGPKMLHPAYTKINKDVGLATRCVPGKKENGAVFNHPVSWAILAEAMLGRAEQAWSYYRAAQPMNPAVPIERYEVEPYVYAEYVTSPDHPTFGQASHSWLTGSATWMFRDALDYLLGVRPTYAGLLVDPLIPAEWKTFSVRRKFRGATYEITVENPDRVTRGVKSIEVDSTPVAGNVLPDFRDGKTHRVRVILG